MSKGEETSKERSVILAGIFAIIAAVISGVFLLINTTLEHQLVLPTPISTNTTIPIQSPVASSPVPPNATKQPTPATSNTSESGSFINDALVPCGGMVVLWFAIIVVTALIPWNWLWLKIFRPLLVFVLCAGLITSVGAFLGSLVHGQLIGMIIGGVVGVIAGGFLGYFFWVNGEDVSLFDFFVS